MITPKEIQELCLKWWKDVLISTVDSVNSFPKEINRIGKINSKDILNKLTEYKSSIELLKSNSKENKKVGYRLIFSVRQFEKIGKQCVPDKILIENIEDYLQVVGKKKEYQAFLKNLTLIKKELPLLADWVKSNPIKLIEHNSWSDTLKVCKYFLETPSPNKYIRQLPINVHTKYIIENKGIIQSLLDFIIPDKINSEETKFELRYNLKYSEPLIRIRYLDTAISPIESVSDISLTLSEFKTIQSNCSSIFVTENIMNFLTLPYLPKTIAIWSGGGFNVSYLKDINWIKTRQFLYWGDIDAQGFQILHQFRGYFPNTIAVMMDDETLSSFESAEGTPTTTQNLHRLTESELSLYSYLKQNNIRLEQEKIAQEFAEEKINKLFQKFTANIPPIERGE